MSVMRGGAREAPEGHLAEVEEKNLPRSRKRKRPRSGSSRDIPWGGAPTRTPSRRGRLLLRAALAILLAGAGLYWWISGGAERDFLEFAERGKPALARVVTFGSDGRDHLAPGQPYRYADAFPTSGPHDPGWTEPGFYDGPRPPTRLVHALEHGNIVIYYGTPAPEILETLKRWAKIYDGQWDGIVVAPKSGLGGAIVLTAWTKVLRLDPFEPEAAAAFIDAFRGRGPERPVR